jgi:AcrR family transcriptional regulator
MTSQHPVSGPATPRATYRHGDLRRALLQAGVDLARDGGPDAVVLREATRRAGVVPNAAYRHFASRAELLAAVRAEAFAAAARSMEQALSALSEPSPRAGAERMAAYARETVRAVGTGYLRFALAEPGLFRTAFLWPGLPDVAGDPANRGDSGMSPLQLLSVALDRLVQTGVMPAERRPGAEFLAWASVHGLALLVLDGPLHAVPADQVQALSQRLLDMVERGL